MTTEHDEPSFDGSRESGVIAVEAAQFLAAQSEPIPTNLTEFRQRVVTPSQDVRSWLRVPVFTVGILGFAVALIERPLFRWCTTKNGAHGLVDYPIHWSSNILSLADLQMWAPYVGVAATISIIVIAITSSGLSKTKYLEMCVLAGALVSGTLVAMPLLVTLMLLLATGIAIAVVYVVFVVVMAIVVGAIICAWASGQ